MMLEMRQRVISCVIAFIVLFMGMCVETTTADSYFSSSAKGTSTTIRAASCIAEEVEHCTMDMLGRGTATIRGNIGRAVSRWQDRALLLFMVVGAILQYLLYYRCTEGKREDQLLMCRAVAVNYIHQKDGGK